MSDLFDRRPKTTKDSKAAKKESKTIEELKARRKTRIISISVISVLLVAFVASMIINSNFIRRDITVITIDGVSFSAVEFDYFLVASNFNVDAAVTSMSNMVLRYNRAMEEGFELTEAMRDELNAEIEIMRFQVMLEGFQSFDQFLRLNYGPAMNMEIFSRLTEMVTIATQYELSTIPDFTFTQDELDEFYYENKDDFDVFTFRFFIMHPDIDLDADDIEAARLEAIEEAKALASTKISQIETEEDFINRAREYDPIHYAEPESTILTLQGEVVPDFMLEWLSDSSRVSGDVSFLVDDMDIIYVVYFVERNDNSYYLTSFRQLLFLRQDPSDPISPEDFISYELYRAEFDRLDAEARLLAREFEQKFIDLGANEAAIDQLVSEHEDMDLDGRLYPNIAKLQVHAMHADGISTMRVVPEIEDWLFTPGRRYGDFELIRTEDFGFHLVYFMGFGERFSNVLAENTLTERERRLAHEAFLDTLEPAAVTFGRLFDFLTSNF